MVPWVVSYNWRRVSTTFHQVRIPERFCGYCCNCCVLLGPSASVDRNSVFRHSEDLELSLLTTRGSLTALWNSSGRAPFHLLRVWFSHQKNIPGRATLLSDCQSLMPHPLCDWAVALALAKKLKEGNVIRSIFLSPVIGAVSLTQSRRQKSLVICVKEISIQIHKYFYASHNLEVCDIIGGQLLMKGNGENHQ